MTQYLLSVHMVEGTEPPPDEEIARMYKEVDTFNDELKAEGAWVFAGGLHPSDTALVRLFGDIDLAEEAVQEAFAVAVQRWRADGVPPNPGGWIVTTARYRAIERLRRESSRHETAMPRLLSSTTVTRPRSWAP